MLFSGGFLLALLCNPGPPPLIDVLKPEAPVTTVTGAYDAFVELVPRDPLGVYVLLVTYSVGDGECKETYTDQAGIVRIAPLSKN